MQMDLESSIINKLEGDIYITPLYSFTCLETSLLECDMEEL